MQILEDAQKDVGRAVNELRKGSFVLLHDSQSRENEVDLVIAAELVSPEHVRIMRQDAGGLLCVAVDHAVGSQLGIGYLHDIFDSSAYKFPILRDLAETKEPYGDKPAFSITVNHRRTYTGVTDQDRALTISQIGRIAKRVLENHVDCKVEFIREFKSPGHIHLLLESDDSLARRRGHTELSLYLCKLAGLTPAMAICEMLDGKTYRALSLQDATSYAQKHLLSILDGEKLFTHFLRSQHQTTMPRV